VKETAAQQAREAMAVQEAQAPEKEPAAQKAREAMTVKEAQMLEKETAAVKDVALVKDVEASPERIEACRLATLVLVLRTSQVPTPSVLLAVAIGILTRIVHARPQWP